MSTSQEIIEMNQFTFAKIIGVQNVHLISLIRKTFTAAVVSLEKANGGFTTVANAWEWYSKTPAGQLAFKGIDSHEFNKARINAKLVEGKKQFHVRYQESEWIVRPGSQSHWLAARLCGEYPEIIDPAYNADSPINVIQRLTGLT